MEGLERPEVTGRGCGMFGWTIAIIIAFALGTAAGVLMRRQRILDSWLREEVAGMRHELTQARAEVRALASPQTSEMLDRVEGEDYEIAGNLDRMNTLLDQLHGLLRGKSPERIEYPRDYAREKGFTEEPVIFSGQLDFTSPEELLKFANLPPISEDEIRAMDWETFLKGIASDGPAD